MNPGSAPPSLLSQGGSKGRIAREADPEWPGTAPAVIWWWIPDSWTPATTTPRSLTFCSVRNSSLTHAVVLYGGSAPANRLCLMKCKHSATASREPGGSDGHRGLGVRGSTGINKGLGHGKSLTSPPAPEKPHKPTSAHHQKIERSNCLLEFLKVDFVQQIDPAPPPNMLGSFVVCLDRDLKLCCGD